jgi:hypothetical protein
METENGKNGDEKWEKRGRSLEGFCQEGRAIFFIFFAAKLTYCKRSSVLRP